FGRWGTNGARAARGTRRLVANAPAMTTAELGLITTALVGVSAAAAPALTAAWNRGHERTMARSTRLYDQRRSVYEDIALFLERARLRLDSSVSDRPQRASDLLTVRYDEWVRLQARTALNGSGDVQAKLAAYRRA